MGNIDFTFIGDLIKNQGLAGVGMVVLAFAVKALFSELKASQEARIKEGGESRTALERNSNALDALKEVIKERR